MRRSIPSIQGLICFESAAKHLSYTYAAQELCITQSAVSRQIQQLEDFLGVNSLYVLGMALNSPLQVSSILKALNPIC